MERIILKRMKTAGSIIILVLIALLLSGCAADPSILEENKDLFVSCMNDHDPDGLYAIMYPNEISKEELEAGYKSMADLWQEVNAEDVKTIRFSKKTTLAQNKRVTVCQGVYQFPEGLEQYVLYLSYKETDDAKGLTEIRMIPTSQISPSVTAAPLSPTVSCIVTVCFIIFSIVDVVRKKPRRWGWYIVLCVVVFWIRFNNVRYIVLPLGALIYWCIRKKLLAKKAAMKVSEMEENKPCDNDQG